MSNGRKNIFLVDDDPEIVYTQGKFLTFLGHKVFSNTNSIKALKEFSSRPYHYDLVITDESMPFMNGTEFAEKILSIRPDIPVIICSGYMDITHLNSKGIKQFLLKPVEFNELAECVNVL